MERANKHKALLDLAKLIREGRSYVEIEWSDEEAVAEFVRSEMASAPRFAKLLESCGVEVPMKPSPTDPTKQVPALAKTDEGSSSCKTTLTHWWLRLPAPACR